MQEVFDKLRVLQGVLAKKFAVLEEVKEIPRTLETKEELLNRGKRTYIEKHERLEKTSEELKALRIALDEAERTREHSEKQMEQISTQRESLLAKEKYFSELQEQLEEHEQLMEIQEEEVKTETEKKDVLLSEKHAEIESLITQEANLTPGIDESILFKFERIIKNKAGVGIVPVHGHVCQGCHMTIPVQFVNDVRKGDDFRFCPYCSRVLYWEDVDGADMVTQHADDSEIEEAGLADFVDSDEFDDLI
jgi:hypothetical protein